VGGGEAERSPPLHPTDAAKLPTTQPSSQFSLLTFFKHHRPNLFSRIAFILDVALKGACDGRRDLAVDLTILHTNPATSHPSVEVPQPFNEVKENRNAEKAPNRESFGDDHFWQPSGHSCVQHNCWAVPENVIPRQCPAVDLDALYNSYICLIYNSWEVGS